MAPERFRGKGDARADIYALGLTLYELLTLRTGFESTDRLTLVERIKTEEPPRPRSLDGRIPRDLETIVLKAIEKEHIASLKDGLADVGLAWDRPTPATAPKNGPPEGRGSPTAEVVVIRSGG